MSKSVHCQTLEIEKLINIAISEFGEINNAYKHTKTVPKK